MPPAERRMTQDDRSALTRNKLAKAAFELIRNYGYGSLRTAAVAKAAGISQGGQLHHYATKDDLAFAAVQFGYALAESITTQNLQRFASEQDPIRALIDDSMQFYFSGAFEVAIDVVKGTQHAELRRSIADLSRQFRDLAERGWLAHLVSHGWSVHEAHDLIDLSTSLVRGFAIRKWIQRDTGQFQRLLDRWVGIIYAACPPLAAMPALPALPAKKRAAARLR